MDLIGQGSLFLAQQRKKFFSVPVTYRRLSGEILEVLASVGQSTFTVDDEYSVTTRTRTTDFLILASDLGFEPEKGDEIIYQNGIYEALSPDSSTNRQEPVWRWSGASQNTYRIHTKLVNFTG